MSTLLPSPVPHYIYIYIQVSWGSHGFFNIDYYRERHEGDKGGADGISLDFDYKCLSDFDGQSGVKDSQSGSQLGFYHPK